MLMHFPQYRPVTLDDVVSHKDIVSTSVSSPFPPLSICADLSSQVDKFIGLNRLPHLLFYGPPGTGKTSTILAVARKLYANTKAGMRNNVLELNASDDRGIETVREEIKNFASTKMVFSSKEGFKLIILDEADMMTTAAQGALRRGPHLLLYVLFHELEAVCVDSDRAIHAKCPLLHHLQLCQSHHSSYSISVYQIQVNFTQTW